MEKRLRVVVIALVILTANAVFGAPEDRFKGGINDGYDKNYVLDAPIPVSGPRIKINGLPYEQIQSISGAEPGYIINGVRY